MFKNIALYIIEKWQIYFSRDHSYWKTKDTKRVCNLYPSCSSYTKEKIEKF
jgi:putative component of membrane protein insertase Oxa1/YidC/SpoIIIJ protein YidD